MTLELGPVTEPDDRTLTECERRIMNEIAGRREELVALACDLITFDTTAR
ncbi:MAG: hypothetical protein K0Q89_764, partial [Thermomicrobiales bacterium]|nr:hypothetical protein [Thermomicrobiales bacterium]